MTRIAAMLHAKSLAAVYLSEALQILDEQPLVMTPESADRVHLQVTHYVQLASEAINRFQEAARGA